MKRRGRRLFSALPIIWSVVAIVAVVLAPLSGCAPRREEPPITAAYGVVPGQRNFDAPDNFVREAGYPLGIFAVPFLESKQLLAFELGSTDATICSRMDDKPFELPLGNVPHRRYNCEGAWTSRDVVFITSTEFLPKRGEQLNWQRLEGESPLARPRSESAGALHSYAATASPALFSGNVLVSAAWFSGEYPPRKEWDELRSEPMAFGHYTLLDRALFIGQSARLPATYLYKADQPEEVREGLQWAFLPDDSSEKTKAHISTIYEIANGYLLRVSQIHDHEGFGVDESEYLYTFQAGRWRFLASAERVRLY